MYYLVYMYKRFLKPMNFKCEISSEHWNKKWFFTLTKGVPMTFQCSNDKQVSAGLQAHYEQMRKQGLKHKIMTVLEIGAPKLKLWSYKEISMKVHATFGQHFSAQSYKTHLSTLIREGKVVRPIRNHYAHKDWNPETAFSPNDLKRFLVHFLVSNVPYTYTAEDIRKEILLKEKAWVDEAEIEKQLSGLAEQRYIDKFKKGFYGWTGPKEKAFDLIATL
jgi:hypothetical protein